MNFSEKLIPLNKINFHKGRKKDFHWAKGIHGNGAEHSRSIALDNAGNLYITGDFDYTADFDPGLGIANITPLGGPDVFFAKYDNNGTFYGQKASGGGYHPNGDFGYDIAVDFAGNVYIYIK